MHFHDSIHVSETVTVASVHSLTGHARGKRLGRLGFDPGSEHSVQIDEKGKSGGAEGCSIRGQKDTCDEAWTIYRAFVCCACVFMS